MGKLSTTAALKRWYKMQTPDTQENIWIAGLALVFTAVVGIIQLVSPNPQPTISIKPDKPTQIEKTAEMPAAEQTFEEKVAAADARRGTMVQNIAAKEIPKIQESLKSGEAERINLPPNGYSEFMALHGMRDLADVGVILSSQRSCPLATCAKQKRNGQGGAAPSQPGQA